MELSSKKIGTGNTADFYDYKDNVAIKLFHEGYPIDGVFKEYRNVIAIEPLSFSHPKCYGLIRLQGRNGILYEKVTGTTLLEQLEHTRNLEECASILAREHKQLLSNTTKDVPSYKVFLSECIQKAAIPHSKKKEIQEKLSHLPEGNTFCHGDYHPGNIMLTSKRKTYIIDFMNACHGPILYDVARTYFLLTASELPSELQDNLEFAQARALLGLQYIEKMGYQKDELTQMLECISYARKGE